MAEASSIGRILGLLGIDGGVRRRSDEDDRFDGPSAVRVVEAQTGAWLELDVDGEVLRMARPKCRMALHLLPVIREWSAGGNPAGSQRDLRWEPVTRRRLEVLEIRTSGWKPLRLTRAHGGILVARVDEIMRFVGSERPDR